MVHAQAGEPRVDMSMDIGAVGITYVALKRFRADAESRLPGLRPGSLLEAVYAERIVRCDRALAALDVALNAPVTEEEEEGEDA